jgi:threonine dehydrogenase-like Zn-dependent dehydrogenase
MRAAVMTNWQLEVAEVPEPTPGPGQVLVEVLACGICGSDLHMLQHGAEMRELSARFEADGPGPDPDSTMPRPQMFEPHLPTVMGHEFCCRVIGLGEGTSRLSEGDIVVSLPVAFDVDGLHTVGYSNRYPGGYAEQMVLSEMLALPVPNGLDVDLAALTEPLAVGVHAVAKSSISPERSHQQSAIVLGLGPVGLACVAELKRLGIGPVIGADFSSARRRLAEHLGCDAVVDPSTERVIDVWRRLARSRSLVIFEAVGVPGMIDQAMRMAPRDSEVLVVGACMQHDHFNPMVGITRELSIRFALGYSAEEFSGALRSIAEGEVDLAPLITGRIDIDGVPGAFDELADPERHAKILVTPGR